MNNQYDAKNNENINNNNNNYYISSHLNGRGGNLRGICRIIDNEDAD